MAQTKKADTVGGELSIVNASGFAFQLAVEDAVKRSQDTHGWEVVTSEHAWEQPEGEATGYVDLVIEKSGLRAVIECKRPQDGTWVFLVPRAAAEPRREAFFFWVNSAPPLKNLSGWSDFVTDPPLPRAAFCTVRGSGEGNRSMLERLASQLLTSIEGLGAQQFALRTREGLMERAWIYISLIVTSARLVTCKFDPQKVDLADGKISVDDAELQDVSVIRFHKTLATTIPSLPSEELPTYKLINRLNERTIFVVRADALVDFLRTLEIPYDAMAPWPPWKMIREAERRERREKETS